MQHYITLECTSCKSRNYTVIKNKKINKDKLVLNKYCPVERKHTKHKEIK
ncbi:50S ribosomal protein L33 [bacterium]|nr:50S ribosomal protein L33 [bacterium]MCK5598168.1 50S ribosomal protein L33 [bacterium]